MLAYRTQVYHLLHWYTVLPSCCAVLHRLHAVPLCRHAISIPIYTQHQPYTAMPCRAVCIPLSVGIYRTFSHAPPHMPLRRSYFDSDGLLLLGYKYPASIIKTLYSPILTVSRLSGGIRLFRCCNRGVVYRVLHGVGWGIYDILRGTGYSLYHTPHIKRGEIRRLACVRPPLGASLLTSGANCVSII